MCTKDILLSDLALSLRYAACEERNKIRATMLKYTAIASIEIMSKMVIGRSYLYLSCSLW